MFLWYIAIRFRPLRAQSVLSLWQAKETDAVPYKNLRYTALQQNAKLRQIAKQWYNPQNTISLVGDGALDVPQIIAYFLSGYARCLSCVLLPLFHVQR